MNSFIKAIGTVVVGMYAYSIVSKYLPKIG